MIFAITHPECDVRTLLVLCGLNHSSISSVKHHANSILASIPCGGTGPPSPLKRVTFPTPMPTRLTAHSPNIYKVAVKHLPATPPSFDCKPPKQLKQQSTIHPPPFPGSLQSLSSDQLDSSIASTFDKETSIPAPAKEAIGKTMYPRSFALSHSTAPMLDQWGRHGCPVDCGKAWDKDQIVAALRRSPHHGANSPQAITFLQAEVADKVRSGYAKVVKWGAIKHRIPRNLNISPVALVPHKSRQYRTILDLSFKLRYKGGIIPSVNDSIKRQAPAESMIQLGNCIQRIIYTLATNYDPNHPFAFAKMELKDGFWRMLVSEADAWNFCYVLPSHLPNQLLDDVDIVVPSSLQMGWCESPPYFCAATETARDVIESLLQSDIDLPDHRFLDKMLEQGHHLHRLEAAAFTTNLLEVFVDDFCAMTNNLSTAHLTKFSKALIHGIHSVFPPPEVTTHQGEDPISQKNYKRAKQLGPPLRNC